MARGKNKRTREEADATEALDVRSVKKLNRLIKQSNEENDLVQKKRKLERFKTDGPDSSDEETEYSSVIPLHKYEEGETYDEDWDRFYQPNTYPEEVLRNIDEAKSQVAEEMSEYCGSFAGDLDAWKAVDDFADLPDDLKNHIGLLKDVLSHYRSGPLPKTIKMLPHLQGYESILEMLDPLKWTVHVYPRAVKVFASKGGDQALYFYENYLLPKVREDIAENRRLSVQLFDSLIGSIFRTEEFVAGIFLPWIRSDMTKIEGVILAHLMKKASIRACFSSVALVLALEEEFSIPRSTVIEAILNKRYFLPEAAIACLVKYFVSFASRDCSVYFTTEGRMPLTWFKSLLTFLELYREGIRPEERDQLVRVCRQHEHPSITPEIRALIGLIPTASTS